MPQKSSAQFVSPSPKVLDFNEKRLHWASVDRGDMHRHLLFRFLWQVHENGYCFSSWVLGFCAKLRACAVPHLDLATTKIESDIPIEYNCILSIIQIYGNLKLPHVPHPSNAFPVWMIHPLMHSDIRAILLKEAVKKGQTYPIPQTSFLLLTFLPLLPAKPL